MNQPSSIIYIHASSLVGGGNKVLLRLMGGLDRQRFRPVSAIPERGPLEEELAALGIPYFIADLRPQSGSRLSQTWGLTKFVAHCLRLRPRVIHVNELPYRLASLGAGGAKRVCHVHHPGSTAEGLRWMFKKKPHLVVSPSQYVVDDVDQCLTQLNETIRTEVLFNPIDVDWFRPPEDVACLRQRLDMNPQEQHISILGALAPHKGHVCFLNMAKRIIETRPETMFHIVGGDIGRDGSHRRMLNALCEELGIAERVRFWGFVDDTTARDILAASDLFVLPTQEEGFGLVVAEAQACQVPVLTSAIRPLDEVVEDGSTGFLFDPNDHQAFATKAVELLADDTRRKAIGTAGRNWVMNRFSQQAHVDRMTSLYEELLSPTVG